MKLSHLIETLQAELAANGDGNVFTNKGGEWKPLEHLRLERRPKKPKKRRKICFVVDGVMMTVEY